MLRHFDWNLAAHLALLLRRVDGTRRAASEQQCDRGDRRESRE
jgi:hypothetical protein